MLEYRILGRTGLRISVLGFGGSSLGGVFGDIDVREAVRSVHTAIDCGINFFDTAPFYGETAAETVLGTALHEIPRDRFYVATKLGRYGMEDFDFSAARVVSSVEESLRRLRVDCIDVMQVHDVEFGSIRQIVEETLPALRRVQQQGKVRFIGVTGFPLKIFSDVLAAADVDTIISYGHYNLNDTSLEDILPCLEEKGVGVIHAAALGMGLLTVAGPRPWHPATPGIKAVCAEAARRLNDNGHDIARLALQFALGDPRIHCVLVGTACSAEVKTNVEWASGKADPELVAEARALLAPILNQTWTTGLPENN